METKKELQKEIDKLELKDWESFNVDFYHNVKAIVARMPDDKSETKPEPSLLEVAMNIKCCYKDVPIDLCFDTAEGLIEENERRKK